MEFQIIQKGKRLSRKVYGGKAARLSLLPDLGIHTPLTAAISIETINAINRGEAQNFGSLLRCFPEQATFAVRPSPEFGEWAGLKTLLHVGITEEVGKKVAKVIGLERSQTLYLDSIIDYAIRVLKLDPDAFEGYLDSKKRLQEIISLVKNKIHQTHQDPYPQCRETLLENTVQYLAKTWESPTAQILREAQGYPQNGGLGLLVQQIVYSSESNIQTVGKSRNIDPSTGKPYNNVVYSTSNEKEEKNLKNHNPSNRGLQLSLMEYHSTLRQKQLDEFEITFVNSLDKTFVLDYRPTPRSVEAEINLAVDLVKEGTINKKEALLRIQPESLSRAIHSRLEKFNPSKILSHGVAASPGAASGVIAFSSRAAEELAVKGQPCILVRLETGPEDIKAMHTAKGVLTGRGGLTSHAAVIARSLGVPCVSAATELEFDAKKKTLLTQTGKCFKEGDYITIDGSTGTVIEGHVPKVQPQLNENFEKFMSWADHYKDIGIRANADTIEEVKVSSNFNGEGIGLCRSEHMFFAESRLTTIREMIFSDSAEERKLVLRKLLPMQQEDFTKLFKEMAGFPVCIRLLDPPLHEFLPTEKEEMQELARALNLPISKVISRCEELREFNPMLGLRGVRLGIIVPEIYEMQAKAIFLAAAELHVEEIKTLPEIMIPLISTNREVELIHDLVICAADEIQSEVGFSIPYKIGVMVETPRAAMRAGEFASYVDFLSFGTNDLTQLTYGISRDDSAKIIDEYIEKDVFAVDPFITLDREGVGELLQMALERGRKSNPNLTVSICGEHSADMNTIRFCRDFGFDYLSCTPYRLPIARLAAAQSAIKWKVNTAP